MLLESLNIPLIVTKEKFFYVYIFKGYSVLSAVNSSTRWHYAEIMAQQFTVFNNLIQAFVTIMLTGGNWQKWKSYSWHVPAIKFIGMKQLVSKVANILEKLRILWKWETWGNILKIWYFVNIFLIEARI